MTITIEVPDETLAALITEAQAQGRPAAALAAEALAERFPPVIEDESPLDDDMVEGIRRGIADMDAGRTVSLDQTRAHIEAALIARFGNTRA